MTLFDLLCFKWQQYYSNALTVATLCSGIEGLDKFAIAFMNVPCKVIERVLYVARYLSNCENLIKTLVLFFAPGEDGVL